MWFVIWITGSSKLQKNTDNGVMIWFSITRLSLIYYKLSKFFNYSGISSYHTPIFTYICTSSNVVCIQFLKKFIETLNPTVKENSSLVEKEFMMACAKSTGKDNRFVRRYSNNIPLSSFLLLYSYVLVYILCWSFLYFAIIISSFKSQNLLTILSIKL